MNFQTVLIKPASGLCNMNCEYCFYCDEMSKRAVPSYGIMSEETLKNVIKKVLKQASGHVCMGFQGGEPTMAGTGFFRKVLYYEKIYNVNHVEIQNTIQTNGLSLDEEWCEIFRQGNFLAGISVDGISKVHDRYRRDKKGGSTHERVMKSIELLKRYQIDFNILTVVTEDAAAHVDEIYRFYKENGLEFQQYIACLDPLDEERNGRRYSLTPAAYGKFLTRLFALWYEDWKTGEAPYIRQFENYIGILLGYCPESCEQRGVCSIQCVIEADGSVYPCDFYAVDAYRLGNMNEDSMEEIFACKAARQFVKDSLSVSGKCRACEYYCLCRGGCRRNRTKENKNYFCEGYKYFFRESGRSLCQVAGCIKKMECRQADSTR